MFVTHHLKFDVFKRYKICSKKSWRREDFAVLGESAQLKFGLNL